MNSKAVIRIVLLAVVAIAVGRWAVKEFGPAKVIASGSESSTSFIRPDGVTVINFHGDKRCHTCVGIGNLAKKTIDETFAAEEQSGQVRWEQINFDEAAHAHFVQDYELVTSTILITRWKNGKEQKWSNLDDVWVHADDEPAFRAYISQGVRELLNEP